MVVEIDNMTEKEIEIGKEGEAVEIMTEIGGQRKERRKVVMRLT